MIAKPEGGTNFAQAVLGSIARRLHLTSNQAVEFVGLPLDQQKKIVEQVSGKPVVVEGPGPLGIDLVSHAEVERQLDDALK
jgi:hypothetical protein